MVVLVPASRLIVQIIILAIIVSVGFDGSHTLLGPNTALNRTLVLYLLPPSYGLLESFASFKPLHQTQLRTSSKSLTTSEYPVPARQ